MTTIEKIKAEIEQYNRRPSHYPHGMISIDVVLQLIDKYAEQEPTDEWQNGYDMAWEEAEVFYEQEPCDDAVSREAVIEILGDYGCTNREGLLFKDIRALPSVTPQEQTGHWIIDKGSLDAFYGEVCKCSECGVESIGESDYCPSCGCRMVEQQERSGEE